MLLILWYKRTSAPTQHRPQAAVEEREPGVDMKCHRQSLVQYGLARWQNRTRNPVPCASMSACQHVSMSGVPSLMSPCRRWYRWYLDSWLVQCDACDGGLAAGESLNAADTARIRDDRVSATWLRKSGHPRCLASCGAAEPVTSGRGRAVCETTSHAHIGTWAFEGGGRRW